MIEWLPRLATAWMLGLLGSGHCLGMCGGLMGALSMAIAPERKHQRLLLLLAYNLGRILSYALAGALLGSLGWVLANSPLADLLRLAAGLLLIAMGLYLSGTWQGLVHIEAIGRGLWRYLQPLASRLLPVRSASRALLLGSLWGWLPCGLVYSTLVWAASQGHALDAALSMLAFGLGTLPTLLVTGLAAERLRGFLQRRATRLTSGILVILFGLWSVPGPHQQWLMGH